ncbi:hypothetical protein [Tellurirhabdus rosea]|uniref:hypothetical protein n=1 Tax=Tellurirhabdus rosea TaxID=2674997 RepID=UPI0022544BF4|nr:hypothetical protein [Tellurirhabdus rosea]
MLQEDFRESWVKHSGVPKPRQNFENDRYLKPGEPVKQGSEPLTKENRPPESPGAV